MVARTIDIETAPLTPSIARRFTSAQSGDSWYWGIGPCDLRASRSGFSRCLGCFTLVFPSMSSMATVSRFLQPGQSRSYEAKHSGWGGHANNCTFGDSAGNYPGFSSMASMGWWGFPAASVSCSAIMHRTPLNRNPWNRSSTIEQASFI